MSGWRRSEGKAKLADLYIANQEWTYALQLDPGRAKAAIRERVAASDFDLDKLRVVLYSPSVPALMDEPLARLLLATFKNADESEVYFAHCLALLSRFAPDETLHAALNLLREKPDASIHVFGPLEAPGNEVIEAIVSEARSRPYPENLGFARLLDDIGHGSRIFDGLDSELESDLAIAGMILALLRDWPERRLEGPLELIDTVLAGERGDFAAFSLAILSPVGDLEGRVRSSWAEVAYITISLESEIVPDGLITTKDSSEATERLRDFTRDQLYNSDQMLDILRALGACMQNCTPDQLSAVIGFWVEIGRHIDLADNNHEAQIQFGVSANVVTLGWRLLPTKEVANRGLDESPGGEAVKASNRPGSRPSLSCPEPCPWQPRGSGESPSWRAPLRRSPRWHCAWSVPRVRCPPGPSRHA